MVARSLSNRVKNLYHLLNAVGANIWYRFPSRQLTVVGVTGTDGKTTTANLIYEFLREGGKKVGLVTTINARIGDEEFDTGFHVTSPDPWHLQKYLRRMVDRGMEYAVLEVTSHGLAQHRVWGVGFNIGVLTNITHEHLDYHGDFDDYVSSKAKLFANVETSVLNADDPSFPRVKKFSSGNIVSYGIKADADHKAKNLSQSLQKQTFSVENIQYETTLPGKYNVSNILAALAVSKSLGIRGESVRSALINFKQLPGRFEIIDEGQDFIAIVDFAHTPESLKSVLTLLRSLPSPSSANITPGALDIDNDGADASDSSDIAFQQIYNSPGIIVVFGCAGLRDTSKRFKMGKIAVELADLSVFTAEDPRTEKVDDIIEQMAEGAISAGGEEGKNYLRIPDRREAIAFAVKKAGKNDIVLVAGKGHEKSLCIGTTEYPWSDQEVMREELRRLGAGSPRGGQEREG